MKELNGKLCFSMRLNELLIAIGRQRNQNSILFLQFPLIQCSHYFLNVKEGSHCSKVAVQYKHTVKVYPITGWMRLNRLFKYECFFVFNSKIVRIIKNGSLYQIGVVTFYLLYVIHLDACVYYQVSSWRNFTGQWAFNETRK